MKRILRDLMMSGAVLVAGFGTASSVGAKDISGTIVGVLNCQESSGWGLVLGSSHTVKCTFTDTAGHSEPYKGRVLKVGLDIGYQHSGIIIWTVLAPTSGMASGALKGRYVGGDVSAAVAIGGGANVLVGGSAKSITLQPISFQGLTGVNIAGGVEGLTLDIGT